MHKQDVKTVAGIFRVLGNKEGRRFISKYVDKRIETMKTQREIINYLETNKRKDKTLAEIALEEFNHMRIYGYALSERYR